MRGKLIVSTLVLSLLILSGCCKKCDLTFEQSELDLLSYELSNPRAFRNNAGDLLNLTFVSTDVDEAGKVCGGFGSPDEDECATRATQSFSLNGGLSGMNIFLDKNKGENSANGFLSLNINMSKADIYIYYEGGTLDQNSTGRMESVTINNVNYTDVFRYDFDPNRDCRNPESDNCVKLNDIVNVDFSLSQGLLRFEVHKGLQTPNEVYTLVN